jgi:hypothetical protein
VVAISEEEVNDALSLLDTQVSDACCAQWRITTGHAAVAITRVQAVVVVVLQASALLPSKVEKT